MEGKNETPHWDIKKKWSNLIPKLIGKKCLVSFKKPVHIFDIDYGKYCVNGVINGYDGIYINVTSTITKKVKKENIIKKYDYYFDLENVISIGIEED